MHILIFLIALINNVYGAKILGLFAHTGKSHQMVFNPLLKRLSDRGHHLTVASFFPIENPPANYKDISFQGIAEAGIETFNVTSIDNPSILHQIPIFGDVLNQIHGMSPFAEMAVNICERAVNWPPLVEALKNQYDVVIVESFTSDCMLGLLHVYRIKVPIIALSTSSLPPWAFPRIGLVNNPSFLPIATASWTSHMTFVERVLNTFLNVYTNIWFWYAIQEKEQEIIERNNKTEVPLYELSLDMTLVLVNTFHPLNGVRPLVPGLIEVGGMHLDDSEKMLPKVNQLNSCCSITYSSNIIEPI